MVDEALWIWFFQERRKGTPTLSPLILKEKAAILDPRLSNEGEFVACQVRLTRWKKRDDIHYICICGAVKDLINKEGLHPQQTYNMDKIVLNYKRLPFKTFAASDENQLPDLK